MKGVLIACGLLASSVSGHVQMSNPYPIRSPLDPNGDESKKDYSYTNPLSSSGSDFPCKGYANDPFRSVATYSPGGEYDLELQGSATHDGGSCQVSLSYDQGSNFQVIHSMLGGCPLTESYKFTIPSDAPTGEALLTWTWFNKVGNREMYMNCAQVTIGDSDDSHSAKQKRDSFSSLPPIFIANVNGPGQCTTIEGYDVNFPLPGPSVEGSVSGTGYNCTGTAPFLGSGSSGSTHSAVSSSPSGHSTAPTTSASTGSKSKSGTTAATPVSSSANAPAMVASSFGSQSARLMSLPTAASADDTDRFTPGKPCVDGTIICGPQGTTWSLCSNGRPVHMGAVAAGTYCAHG
ncbi:lytic polysaccharide monooxygenase, partial [Aspergillus carbonarius ITEM 5010]